MLKPWGNLYKVSTESLQTPYEACKEHNTLPDVVWVDTGSFFGASSSVCRPQRLLSTWKAP